MDFLETPDGAFRPREEQFDKHSPTLLSDLRVYFCCASYYVMPL